MDCSPPGSPVHGIFQARILEWVAISFSRGSLWPSDWTWVSALAGGFFTSLPLSHQGNPITYIDNLKNALCRFVINFMKIISYLMKSATWIFYSAFMLLRFIHTVCGSGSLISLMNFIGEHNDITLCNIPWFVYLVFVWIVSRCFASQTRINLVYVCLLVHMCRVSPVPRSGLSGWKDM